mmetsp:Transcript_60916/g.176188  ORF Transcript_60916/g.176188 Transcript_60916/m.176188 type:complete len:613 (+) Transcript_60916:121-1959(+)
MVMAQDDYEDSVAMQKEKVKRIFRQCDKNGDGDISLDELGALLKGLGRFQNNEIKAIFLKMDKNGDGSIQYEEFVDWIFGNQKQDAKAKVAMMAKDSERVYQMAFYNACPAGTSELDGKSFAKLCKDAGLFDNHFTQADAGILFTKAVGKGSPKVNFEQFEDVLQSVAERKGVELDAVRNAIVACSRPQSTAGGGRPSRFLSVPGGVGGEKSRPKTSGAELPMSPSGGRPRSRDGSELSALAGGGAKEPSFSTAMRDVVFKTFSGARPELDCDSWVRAIVKSGLLGEKLSMDDVNSIFSQVAAQSQSRISYRQFELALRRVLEKTHMSVADLEEALKSGASRAGSTSPQKQDSDDDMDFGESDGMGRSATYTVGAPQRTMARIASVCAFSNIGRNGVNKSRSEFERQASPSVRGSQTSPPQRSRRCSDSGDGMGASPAFGVSRSRTQLVADFDKSPGSFSKSRSGADLRSPVAGGNKRVDPQAAHDELVAERVSNIFHTFCSGGSQTDIDGKGFAKFCKDSGLLDKQFTAADVDITFAQVVGQSRRMGAPQFEEALKKIALRKKTDVRSVEQAILSCNGPTSTGTVTDYVRLYDDFIDRPHAQVVAARANLR